MKIFSLLDIEMIASRSTDTIEVFTDGLWHLVVANKNKKQVNKLAKDLNIYPHPANVYQGVKNYLVGHIMQN